ncbi:TPA: hypothetical protein RG728_000431 [Morganella morganii subsp. morganii]|uniref:Uncharacterized protein n=1 Tax=Morganella morganii TaxID=582 RepID=A0AAU8ZLC8_MORMO|nr:hypothetical protein [Morganella morganii]HDU8691386.1 hypothetical protein [Morganella morganii subsp. morganii]AWC93683.1 hypothetical protein AM380_08605 [Morganella morganii]EKW8486205.1 hypothetical protein [Morganella morganii]HAT3626747.1 hypothetical protein [Morganella morganii]HCU0879413.1 hypothetical protein [Morganella morganii]
MPDITPLTRTERQKTAMTFATLLKDFKLPIHEDNKQLNKLMNALQSGNKDTANAYDMAMLQACSSSLNIKCSALSAMIRQHKENLSTPIGNMR